VLQGFGGEGRIPPYGNGINGPGDFRFNPRLAHGALALLDDPSLQTVRLQRVFDTWSTAYTTAPVNSWVNNSVAQMLGKTPPLYPSYPAPYPIALRGLQIQIRVVDPSSTHVKLLTIRHDFSDKL
jgi:hypothetical protein